MFPRGRESKPPKAVIPRALWFDFSVSKNVDESHEIPQRWREKKMKNALAFVCFAASLVLCVPAHAQGIEGDWLGSFQESRSVRHIVLHISSSGGTLKGSVDVPDEFDYDNALDSISFENSMVKFALGPFSFEGKLSADG